MKRRPYFFLVVLTLVFLFVNIAAIMPPAVNVSSNLSHVVTETSVFPIKETSVDHREDNSVDHQQDIVSWNKEPQGVGFPEAFEFSDIVPLDDPPEITGYNYTMTTPVYSWIDASDGDLYYIGIESPTSFSFPFAFEFYGESFTGATVYPSGLLSFTGNSPGYYHVRPFPLGVPNSEYLLAPFWADLEVERMFVKQLSCPERLVLQFEDIYYREGGLAGTFQVILYAWGDIEFQYDWLQGIDNYTVGLNYGLNTSFYNAYTFSSDPVDDLALRFEYNPIVVWSTSPLAVSSANFDITWYARSNETIDDYHIFLDSTYNGSTASMSYPFTGISENWHNIEIKMETGGANYSHIMDLAVDLTSPTVTIDYPLNDTELSDGKVNWSVTEAFDISSIEVLVDGVLHTTLEPWIEETYLAIPNEQWVNITVVAYDEALNYGADNVTVFYNRTVATIGMIYAHQEMEIGEVFDHYQTLGHITVELRGNLSETDLESYDILFVTSSNYIWPDYDIGAVEFYLSSGGILVTIGDGSLSNSVRSIIAQHGISFGGEEHVYHDTTTSFDASHPLMESISSLYVGSMQEEFQVTTPGRRLLYSPDGLYPFGVSAELGATKILSLAQGFGGFIDLDDNRQLFTNIVENWLTVQDHDLCSVVVQPQGVGRGYEATCIIGLINQGNSTETSLTLELWIDETLEASLPVASLDSGEWTELIVPIVIDHAGTVNITSFVAPVMGEVYVANNNYTVIASIEELTILEPTPGATLNGGSVFINYSATNFAQMENLTVRVNGMEVYTLFQVSDNPNIGLIVPVFQNGTNVITLLGAYPSGAITNGTVSITSENIVPRVETPLGSYSYYEGEAMAMTLMRVNTSYDSWVSQFEINCTMTFSLYQTDHWETIGGWLVVNVLNGWISQEGPTWPSPSFYLHGCFMWFSGLAAPERISYQETITEDALPAASVGDKGCFQGWNFVATVTGEGVWNGYAVHNLEYPSSSGTLYLSVLKCNGMLVQYSQGIFDIEIVDSNMLPPIGRDPIVSSPPDLDLPEDATNPAIQWVASGNYPANYFIYVDGVNVDSGPWEVGHPISHNLTPYMTVGIHNHSIVFFDMNGDSTMDSVEVAVQNLVAPTIEGPSDLSIEEGSTGNAITWVVFDTDPATYQVLENGSVFESDTWDGENIVISLDGLEVGAYNYTCTVYDREDRLASDTVIVTVTEATTTTDTTTTTTTGTTDAGIPFDPLTIIIIVGVVGGAVAIIVIVIFMKKRGKS